MAELVLTKLATVDNCHRVHQTSETEAKTYGFNQDLLEQLVTLGLSCELKHQQRYFDSDDLYNLSLYMALPSIHKMAMRSWATAFKQSHVSCKLTISYSLQYPLDEPLSCSVLTFDQGNVQITICDPLANWLHAGSSHRRVWWFF